MPLLLPTITAIRFVLACAIVTVAHRITSARITVLHWFPSGFRHLVDAMNDADLLPDLRLVVLGSSRGYVGPYGAEAFLAVLLGLPAIVVADEFDEIARNDIGVAAGFLRRPTFGQLRVVGADEVARVDELLLVRAD